MPFSWRIGVVILSLCPLFLAERTWAELWLCPGPDGTEAFSDGGGPGCHKKDGTRSAPLPATTVQQLPPFKSEQETIEAVRRCAQAGNVRCMLQVSGLLLAGTGTPATLQEAREWARKALAKGDQRAALYLAKAYLTDPNNRFIVDGKADHVKYDALAHRSLVQRADQIEALEALAGAAGAGFIPARLLLATLLYEQSGGMPAERVAQLLQGLQQLPPVYQTLLKTTQQVLALGPTHASPKMVTDALKSVSIGAMAQAQHSGKDVAACKDYRPITISHVTSLEDAEWLPLKHPLIVNSYPLKGRWTEEWTVMVCNTPYSVRMQFQADGLGGAYHQAKVQ